MPHRPNLLLILTDQQAADTISGLGNTEIHTPAMDGLAQSGKSFGNAYCTFPICSPSRSSIFTGRMPSQAGVWHNSLPICQALRPYEMGTVFQAAGYECVYGGKWHLPDRHMSQGHGFRKICDHDDTLLADASVDFLQRKHDRPFFMVASFDNPHDICGWARGDPLHWGDIPSIPDIKNCPELPHNFSIPRDEPEAIRAEQRKSHSLYPVRHYDAQKWREYRFVYHRLIEKVDKEIGRILCALKNNGLQENTMIVFGSDHGDGYAAHQWNQKSVLYEECIRVPLIVSCPGRVLPATVDNQHLVSIGLDIFPTFCDYAGVKPPQGLQGRSLRPLLESESGISWREQLVVETVFDSGGRTRGLAVRTTRYKYSKYSWGQNPEQLFDLHKDRGETTNLVTSDKHQCVLDDHRQRLGQWCQNMAGWDSNPVPTA